MKERILSEFSSRFGGTARCWSAAGRINLIGEHTDYNGGYVLPGAIDKVIVAAIRPNGTDRVRAFSLDYAEAVEFGLSDAAAPAALWSRYLFGVCREMRNKGGKVEGFDTVFAGNVPLGAGLSSSAALESVFAFALNDLFDNKLDLFTLARIGQATEHNWCGVKCGIMDQFASCFGKAGQLIRLNCKTLEHQYFPFNPEGYKVVLLDTCVKHELASSAYNRRRASCENAAAAIRKRHPEVEFLSDALRPWLDEVKDEIPEEDFHRAEYVIGEAARVLDVCDALEKGDYERVGERMYETHDGLSRLYEVSCPELDFLVKLARKQGVTGARVMGGGFGGCTINLVPEARYDDFLVAARNCFAAAFGHEPKIYPVVISDGAREL